MIDSASVRSRVNRMSPRSSSTRSRFEMATSLIDLLTRRTRAHLHDARATLRGAPRVASLVAPELGWSEEELRRQLDAYESLVRREFSAAGLTL